ncbi:hypothetical protein [Streptomyces clavifer]
MRATPAPRRTPYVPWPLLRAGRNDIMTLELDGVERPAVEPYGVPELG